MSTDYHFQFVTPIRTQDLFDGRLNQFGIIELFDHPLSSFGYRMLTDDKSHLSVWGKPDGDVFCLSPEFSTTLRSGAELMGTIAGCFGTQFTLYTEHHPKYWGFDTFDELNAAMKKLERESRDKFYADVLQYVSGDEKALKAKTIGLSKAEIAKTLISKDPALIRPEKKDELLQSIDEIYFASEKRSCNAPPWSNFRTVSSSDRRDRA